MSVPPPPPQAEPDPTPSPPASTSHTSPAILAFLEAVPDPSFVIDRKGTIIAANEASARLLGVKSAAALRGRIISGLIMNAHRQAFKRYIREAAEGDPRTFENRTLETRLLRSNRTPVAIEASVGAAPMQDLVAVFVRDISRRKNLEAEVLRVAEEERRRLAADLHDSLCQEISAVHFGVCTLRKIQGDNASPELVSLINSVIELTAAAVEHARGIAHGLSPMFGKGASLADALQHLINTQADLHPITCTFRGSLGDVELSEETASQLYHIAAEALQNARKHANATHIEVHLQATHKQLTLRILDDGEGMSAPLPTAPAEGRGLKFMHYRAGQIGASLQINSTPATGTTIICQMDDPSSV